MAVRKTETGVDLDSRRILLLRQQEEGKLNKLRYVGPTAWNGATVPIYVDAKELTISTEPTDWSVHLGNLRSTNCNGRRVAHIRTVETSERGIVFEADLKGKYLVDAIPPVVHDLLDALATGKSKQLRMLYPLSW